MNINLKNPYVEAMVNRFRRFPTEILTQQIIAFDLLPEAEKTKQMKFQCEVARMIVMSRQQEEVSNSMALSR